MSLVLGIDIGGTNIAGGIIDATGNILQSITMPSEGALGKEAVLGNLCKLIDRLLSLVPGLVPGPVDAIGIGTAGEVDPERGVIISATDNIPRWTGTRLKE